jgi:hypothetical protein
MSNWANQISNPSLFALVRYVFNQLRNLEKQYGLYKQIPCELPDDLYKPFINAWCYYLQSPHHGNTVTIHGNEMKYGRPASPQTSQAYISFHKNLQMHFHKPSLANLWLEEIVKREITEENEKIFFDNPLQPSSLSQFLNTFYVDYKDQIDRYIAHTGQDGNMIVNEEGRGIDLFEKQELMRFEG